jgi:hypothetical protein
MPDLRAALLDALDQLSCPLGHPELSAYLRVFHDLELHPGDLARVHRTEQQAYFAGEQRDVWLCPAILDFVLGVRAADSLLTRSDWPLAKRIVYKGADPARQVWLTKMLSHFTLVALQQGRPAAHLLSQEATKRAELLLCADDILAGLRTTDGEDEHLVDERLAAFAGDLSFRLMLWYEAAEDAYAGLVANDHQTREQATKKLAHLSEEVTLFGARPAG